MLNEFELIEKLTANLPCGGGEILRGIGDDCACLKIGDRLLLVSNDDLNENTHFKRFFPPRGVGYKLIAANVSDILACGGVPRFVSLSIALDNDCDEWVSALYDGIGAACVDFGVSVIGGNTTKADSIRLGAVIIGECDRFIARGGAEIGDDLWLSAPLGGSAAGLEALLAGDIQNPIVNLHLYPKIALNLQPLISHFATSAIDISDGFLGDIGHLIKSGNCGFEINNINAIAAENIDIDYALKSGEEYQLLFTASKNCRDKFQKSDAILIGRAIYEKSLIINGKKYDTKGFYHF